MTVRPLGPTEWSLLRELRLACLRDAPDSFATELSAELVLHDDAWRERLAGAAWFVAESDSGPAGIVRGVRYTGGPPGLHSMWVHPAHRGTGVGEQLVAAVRSWANADGAAALTLWAFEDNAVATGLYRRVGFVPTGARRRRPPHQPEIQWSLRLP